MTGGCCSELEVGAWVGGWGDVRREIAAKTGEGDGVRSPSPGHTD